MPKRHSTRKHIGKPVELKPGERKPVLLLPQRLFKGIVPNKALMTKVARAMNAESKKHVQFLEKFRKERQSLMQKLNPEDLKIFLDMNRLDKQILGTKDNIQLLKGQMESRANKGEQKQAELNKELRKANKVLRHLTMEREFIQGGLSKEGTERAKGLNAREAKHLKDMKARLSRQFSQKIGSRLLKEFINSLAEEIMALAGHKKKYFS